MKRMMILTVLAAALLGLNIFPAHSVPKPAEVPTAWQFDIRYERPTPVMLDVPGKAAPQLFWYMKYTVVNNTDKDRIFVPTFVLYTDNGEVIRAGDPMRVPQTAFGKIKRLLNDPLLKDEDAMTGKLLQGEDNAKAGLAIWPDFDAAAGVFDVFIHGLSGEKLVIPLAKPVKVKEMNALGEEVEVLRENVILGKTLKLTYQVAGEAAARRLSKPKLIDETYVMR